MFYLPVKSCFTKAFCSKYSWMFFYFRLFLWVFVRSCVSCCCCSIIIGCWCCCEFMAIVVYPSNTCDLSIYTKISTFFGIYWELFGETKVFFSISFLLKRHVKNGTCSTLSNVHEEWKRNKQTKNIDDDGNGDDSGKWEEKRAHTPTNCNIQVIRI